ncbi:DUF3667 domain-containing protein [Maricaulis sp.]|uniref:DUF3667 domain-containing protein n=1 Tax=unclassified Maricaulis TaxID=2632371 RepID=UPI001B23AB67|nr:DUF3667 domain-containing protein [Maricaulis sp.]MBO6797198.1 DUF3667 domain-containing protein [Maricaulis sp.]
MSGADTVTDAIIAGSGAGEIEDAIHASKRTKRNRDSAFQSPTAEGTCSNCGTQLSGPVCHSCGQTADSFHRPVWELLTEIFDGLFGFEGRMWRTIPPLLYRPGHITRQYLSGVRARYVMPFRLYLTASVLFFLVVFGATNMDFGDAPTAAEIEAQQAAVEQGLVTAREQMEAAGMSGEEIDQALSAAEAGREALAEVASDPVVQAAQEENWKESAINGVRVALVPELYPELVAETSDEGDAEAVPGGVIELEEGVSVSVGEDISDMPLEIRRFLADQAESVINDDGQLMRRELEKWIPRVMFIMVPVYGFLLAFMHFYKRGYFFYDHMVVSLHFHAFLYLFMLVTMGISAIIGAGWAIFILLIWSNFYLYRIHRRVYDHGRFSSALRVIVLNFAYSILLAIGTIIALFLAFLSG